MKTFTFYQKNSSVIVTLSAPTFNKAEAELFDHVKSTYGWRVIDEDGEDQ